MITLVDALDEITNGGALASRVLWGTERDAICALSEVTHEWLVSTQPYLATAAQACAAVPGCTEQMKEIECSLLEHILDESGLISVLRTVRAAWSLVPLPARRAVMLAVSAGATVKQAAKEAVVAAYNIVDLTARTMYEAGERTFKASVAFIVSVATLKPDAKTLARAAVAASSVAIVTGVGAARIMMGLLDSTLTKVANLGKEAVATLQAISDTLVGTQIDTVVGLLNKYDPTGVLGTLSGVLGSGLAAINQVLAGLATGGIKAGATAIISGGKLIVDGAEVVVNKVVEILDPTGWF